MYMVQVFGYERSLEGSANLTDESVIVTAAKLL